MNKFKMRFYHQQQQCIFDVVALDGGTNTVAVIKFLINGGDKQYDTDLFKMAEGVLIQFTGKPDKNDKDIYAGDEVLFGDNERGFVEWNDKKLKWQIRYNEGASVIDLGEVESEFLSIIGSKYNGEYYGHN